MSREKPFELGWYAKDHNKLGGDIGLAEFAISKGGIDQQYAKNGYITTTLYPNDMFFVLFRKNKPPKQYFNSANASVFRVVDGEISTLYHREQIGVAGELYKVTAPSKPSNKG